MGRRKSIGRENRCLLQPLERRVFLAAPGDVLTKAIRQELLNHLNVPDEAYLQTKLNNNQMGAFDGALLTYMQTRGGQAFFWNTSDVTGIKNFINTNLATATVITNADSLIANMFPDESGANYTVNMGTGDINWSYSNGHPEFVHTLNRHDFWQELSQAYVLTNDAKYINELIDQLSSWSLQSPALSDPNQWATDDPPWLPLDVAFRADNWSWVYQQVVGAAGWTGDANTLFLYKLYQHGDFLHRVKPYEFASNRSLFEASGLLQISQLMPEFDNAATWETYARTLLFNAMDGQFHADGGHAESSPGYAGIVLNSLLEAYWLDQKKGDDPAWDAARKTKLENAAKSHVQLLTPDGKTAALSDSYRGGVDTFWDRARIILNNTTDFPAAKPRLRDVWLFGPTTCNPLLAAPITPALPNRGASYAMANSGYYIMRSGADSNARQLTFDAGPTGGQHGHPDLLNFELFGYGAPLISDPGLYSYDASTRRTWATSTPAHNTISVDNLSHASLEKLNNPGIWSSGLSSVAGGYQITASHRGYQGLVGAPVVSRSIWYDGTGAMLVVDWAESATAHTFTQSFLMPGTTTTANLGAGTVRTQNAGGNVKIQTLLQTGQAAGRQFTIAAGTNVFTSNNSGSGKAQDATRYYVNHSNTTFAGFVSLLTTYNGAAVPDVAANVIGAITPSGSFQVQLVRDGVESETITFQPPALNRPGADFRPAGPTAAGNDIAWDAQGRLHMVFNDRGEKNLKYSVRETNGKWTIVQTIDNGFETGGWPSLALDSNGVPSVAYFDGGGGDLKYAKLFNGAWQVETVDAPGSTGLYPSLVMSRNNGAMIGYYKRTTGDLRMAIQVTGGWQISTIDSQGDVGRSASMTLDPNRPTASKIAIAYDAIGGMKKFAIQQGTGWNFQTVDNTMPTGGGSTSMAWEPYKDADGTYHAAMSYYDSNNSALKFARQGGGGVWTAVTVIEQGVQGLYTSLLYDLGNRPNIFFFKKTNVTAYRVKKQAGEWKFAYLGTGGREAQSAIRPSTGEIGLTNLDAELRVEILPA